jgi:uncharacterized protein YukE
VIPYDYDDVTLAVNPDGLLALSQQAVSLGLQVGDEVIAIQNVMSGLQLSWTGDSGQAAQSFNDRWNAMMTQMFGPAGDSGVLNALAQALGDAANNFDSAEQNISVMFTQLHNSIGNVSASDPMPGTKSIGAGPAPGPAQDILSTEQSAVGETFN